MKKICIKCHEEKDIEMFGLHNQRKDGRCNDCKECRNKRNRERPGRTFKTIITDGKIDHTCSICKINKPLSEFGTHLNKAKRKCVNSYCRDCTNMIARDPSKRRNRKTTKDRIYQRTRTLKKFNITYDEFQNMLSKQSNLCLICQRAFDVDQRINPSIDHDHSCCPKSGESCGKCIRGILCQNCNVAIGLLNDDRFKVERALNYLSQ